MKQVYKVFSTAFTVSISQKDSIKKIENFGFRLNDENKSWQFSFNT